MDRGRGVCDPGGNHTEEFALPLQFAGLYLFWQAERRGGHTWRGFLIGLTFAGCFLLRQNLIGVHLAIIVVLALTRAAARRWRALAVSLASIAAGAAAVFLLVAVYFAAQGALAALWDQAFHYNAVYAGNVGISDRLMALAVGLYTLAPSGAAIAAIAGWLIALLLLLRNRERLGPGRPLVLVALAGLPLEMGLSALSGFPFPHYFTALLPTCAVLAGFVAYSLASGEGRERAVGRALVVVALVAAMILPLWQGVTMVTTPSSEAAQDRAVVEYVTRATGEDDTVLIWGAVSKLNYMAHRRSPTRYHYQYPLYMPGYQTAPMVAQFLAEIEANRPALIIDTASPAGWLPPLDPSIRAGWAPGHFYTPLPEMEMVYAYIGANYRVIGAVGWMQWPVYAPVGREVSAP
ncbi:MAG: hypothetical protein M5R40_08820 [Anaerolineae bacterium]|nr:hypothetical protein [Anaerolineae bacterium]